MRSGRVQAPNGNLVDYILQTLVEDVVRRAMKDAYFFVLATGRSCITQRDIQIGFMNAAHECCAVDPSDSVTTPRRRLSGPATAPGESHYFSDDATSGESDEEDATDEFSSALVLTLAGAARERASLMKRRAYEWHLYEPSEPIELAMRNAVDLIIRRVQFRPP